MIRKESKEKKCHKCGYEDHMPGVKCPATGAQCNYCKKNGHFATVCRKRPNKKLYSVDDIDLDDYMSDSRHSDQEILYIGKLTVGQKDNSEEWYETLNIGKGQLKCQLDTGAKACVITLSKLNSVASEVKLTKTHRRLVSFSGHQIVPKGSANLDMSFGNYRNRVKFYVIDGDQMPILSGEACKSLGLVQRVHQIDPSLTEMLEEYPDLENASGSLPGTYSIKIDPTAQPVVHGPRRQPAALRSKIDKKLREMETQGHIVKVKEPTDWVNSMVV